MLIQCVESIEIILILFIILHSSLNQKINRESAFRAKFCYEQMFLQYGEFFYYFTYFMIGKNYFVGLLLFSVISNIFSETTWYHSIITLNSFYPIP